MSKPEIMKRMISSESEVEAHRIQSGYLNREDWMKIGQATARRSDAPIYIDDSANLTMLQIRAKAQRLALEHGIDLLVVDYLQLVSGSGRRYENRTQEVTEISRGLKKLAKELDLPVIAVSQLNREVEKRAVGRNSATCGRAARSSRMQTASAAMKRGDRVIWLRSPGRSSLTGWRRFQEK